MEDKDFPLGLALFKLFLEPLALGPQVEKFPVAVQNKNLGIAIVEGIDHVIAHHGIQEIGENERETAFQPLDDALEVVVVAGHGEDGQGLADAVERAEGLVPILVGRTLSQITATHKKSDVGMMGPSLHDQAVGDTTDGVLHVAHIHERESILT